MVRVKVPVCVLRMVLTVKVDEPEVVTDEGLKLAFARRGSPLTLNVTVPLKPVPAVTVAVKEVPPPCTTVREAGDAESEKSGWTVMVRVGGLGSVRPTLSVTVNVVT